MNETNNPNNTGKNTQNPPQTEWPEQAYAAYPMYATVPEQPQEYHAMPQPPLQQESYYQGQAYYQQTNNGAYAQPVQGPQGYPPKGNQPYYNNLPQNYHMQYTYAQAPPQVYTYQPIVPAKATYKWNLADYDEFTDNDKATPRRRKGSGFIIFSVCLLVSLSVSLAVIAGMSLFMPQQYSEFPGISSEESVQQSSSSHEPVSVSVSLAGKPQDEVQAISGGSRLTIPQVAERVIPSVVSVVKYSNRSVTEPSGMGSGVILTEDGYMITNAHVVSGGTEFKVHLHNGEAYDADVIGVDTATDLAVLKIDAKNLTPAQFGNSDDIKVGEVVVAIGNPVNLSFAGSVTQGIVSALNRQIDDTRYSVSYIQTDAAINPGNSGGALVNEYGQVIGINVAKISATGYEGMGFAIPMSEAGPVIEEILANGYVTGRVKLGIHGYVVDEYDAQRYGWKPGVMIESIDHNSDLIGKDVQKGDIITHIDDVRIENVTDIHKMIEGKKIGDTLRITISRKDNTKTTEIIVEVKLVEDIG